MLHIQGNLVTPKFGNYFYWRSQVKQTNNQYICQKPDHTADFTVYAQAIHTETGKQTRLLQSTISTTPGLRSLPIFTPL